MAGTMTTPQPVSQGSEAGPQDPPLDEAKQLIGQVLSDRYRVDAVLGVGGMGAVYRAEHLLMHKRVAIKVLHREMTQLPEAVQRFEREAMAAGHIEHPNVATAYDFGKLDNGSFFLVLEYVEGKSLRELLDQEKSLTVERAVHVTRQMLQGLIRAHGSKIVHRDLKPENVMLVERDGDPDFVKLLDFGIAKVPVGQMAEASRAKPTSSAALTQLGMVYGTPEYMAPEQALGQDVDLRADLYALGVMFFEMLAGQRPFNAPSPVQILGMVIAKPVPTFAEVAPEKAIPPQIEAVIRQLLAKLPDERFADARSALAAIDGACPPVPLSALGSSGSWGGAGAVKASTSMGSMAAAEAPGAQPAAEGGALSGLKKLDPRVLLGAGGVGLVLLLVAVALLFRKGDEGQGPVAPASAPVSASAEPPPPPPRLSDDEIQAAKSVEALTALKAKAPQDARVLKALAKAQTEGKQTDAALATLGELFAVDEAAKLDRGIRASVVQFALTEKKPDAVLAFADEKMGAGGVDVFYELSLHPKALPPLKKRATELLNKAQDRASPALKVVLGLRQIGGKDKACGQAAKLKQLFAEAKEGGDGRALPFLGQYTDTKGCGFFLRKTDCYGCLRGDNALNEAITAIKEREKKP